MQNRDFFSGYHPAVNFLYFGLVLAFSMVFMHPVCLTISVSAALAYCIYLRGRRALRPLLTYLLPAALLAAVLNPVFNHEGATILLYFSSGNPLTLESIVYGFAAAAMLASVVLWFSCYHEIMTTDKFVYLFGRVIPSLSLVLSMTLRLVPRLRAQARAVAAAQRCAGGGGSGGIMRRARSGLTIFSALVTWSLESSIETADSMRSRGFGLPGRTAFSLYRFDGRDRTATAFLLACGGYILAGALRGGLSWHYYPTAAGSAGGPYTLSLYGTYLALCLLPLFLDIREEQSWRTTESGERRAGRARRIPNPRRNRSETRLPTEREE